MGQIGMKLQEVSIEDIAEFDSLDDILRLHSRKERLEILEQLYLDGVFKESTVE